MTQHDTLVETLAAGLAQGSVIPYFGPGVLELGETTVPTSQALLAQFLASKTSIPFKLRTNLTAAAQYVENFKHRKTLTRLLSEAFERSSTPTSLYHTVAMQHRCPMIVDTWYDSTMQSALGGRASWGQVQGVSHADYPGQWYRYLNADGSVATDQEPSEWDTVLYKPLGSIAPGCNFIVSDSDFVEILTEIDIQAPIPRPIQERRSGRHFLFLGCRFNNQIDRIFARQIMKRSSDVHWAVLPQQLTRNELRFLVEQNIAWIEMPLADFAAAIQCSGRRDAVLAS